MKQDAWLLRTAERNEARLEHLSGETGAIRVSITRAASSTAHDIQVNQAGLAIRRGTPYVVALRARADAPRSFSFGVAQAHEPWANLGLYRTISVGTEWQQFDEIFVAAQEGERARIHFDLGGSETAVELCEVCIHSLLEGPPAPAARATDPTIAARSILDESPVPAGSVQFGSFLRATPVSRDWGWDRGTPVDRYYIGKFLERNAGDIHGRVLEGGDDSYTRRFGSSVDQVEILDVSERNPRATIVADLVDAPHIPSGLLDCIVLTQTLQFIFDVPSTLRTLHRILKPGGVLLATFPGISHTNDREWGANWYWNFTSVSARRLFHAAFDPAHVEIETHGNVLSAISFLHGLAAEELGSDLLDLKEPGYEVTITVKATKSA